LTFAFPARYHPSKAMAHYQLSIQIERPHAALVSNDWLRRTVETALTAAGVEAPTELGLVIAGDGTVRELNMRYRGIDDTTDVLAFALAEPGEMGTELFVAPPDGTSHLGEVIISYPKAEAQAGEHGHSVKRELALLIAHGVLHLLGYDHGYPAEEERMRAMEARILEALDV
jgi:probable rRNA maturation factor